MDQIARTLAQSVFKLEKIACERGVSRARKERGPFLDRPVSFLRSRSSATSPTADSP